MNRAAQLWSKNEIDCIRERAIHMEKNGTVDDQFLDWIRDRVLFKMFVPEQLGGRMADLPEALRIFEESAWIDGSFGWTVTIGAGGGFFVPFMEPGVCQSLFSEPAAVIAGSGYPSGRATAVEGGYRVSGTWKYCSGARHATMFTANALIEVASDETESADASPVMRAFTFMPDQVQIESDWDAFGLKATDSHTIRVEQAFVPVERTFSLVEPYGAYQHPTYRYPFPAFAAATFAAVALGIGRHFLDEAERMAAGSRDAWHAAKPERVAFTEQLIAEGRCAYEEAARKFMFHVDMSWRELKELGTVTEESEREVSLQARAAAQSIRAAVDSIFPYMGMGAIMEHSMLNHIWRDLHTACQHTSLVSFQ
ncbi:acyl-CoA dehydrogenase [Paenibacillus sp. UMB4589-SE434]|uniref:acyl-CoA dehydrogenase n=1 Tax=Paenibacillus sp. UMB4589-SE434 TaxID=3046314 RepID=UPI00254FE88A|nr:acyl-CoA dehydrogenase [Paenibacillus sp. UMB4589-SE434]MDK8183656.1 acyl-CoA dehydrogenase [Paenibacillus sp. UMB4589-SE434]